MGAITAVQVAMFVDAGSRSEPARRERARETVRIGIVVTDDGEFLAISEEIV